MTSTAATAPSPRACTPDDECRFAHETGWPSDRRDPAVGLLVTGGTYPATPYLRRMAADNRWQGQLVRDRHGEPVAIVAVRIGPTWTDAVAIEGEDRTVAVRTRTHDDGLILPTDLPDGSGAVWRRDGRTEDVLAELLELQEERPQ